MNCAPSVLSNTSSGASSGASSVNSCMSDHDIKSMATAFNNYIKNNPMCVGNGEVCAKNSQIDLNSDIHSIYSNLKINLKPITSKEWEWLDYDFIYHIPEETRDNLLNHTWKPKAPIEKHSWLDDTNIKEVLKQYEKLDPEFKLIGVLPSNFYEVPELKSRIKQIYNDIPKYRITAAVINHDVYGQPGSHWIALVIDNYNQLIEYYDPAGDPVTPEIQIFIDKLLQKFNYQLLVNHIKHQKQNSECGVYSIYYIVQRIMHNNFEDLTQNPINDRKMNQMRSLFFRPYS